eukprot:SAG11_NODE_13820_length_637_cov_68.334572_2_plen_71_part_00
MNMQDIMALFASRLAASQSYLTRLLNLVQHDLLIFYFYLCYATQGKRLLGEARHMVQFSKMLRFLDVQFI